MKRLRWALGIAVPAALLALTTLSSCQKPSAANPILKTDQDGIIGGKLVAADDLIQRVIVRILMKSASGKYSSCTGTIIANRFILTAAHCFQQSGEGRVEPERLYLSSGIEASFSRVFIHPDYDDKKRFDRNDLAMLEFLSGNDFGIASLPKAGEEPAVSSGYFVAGYGRTDPEVPVATARLYKLESTVTIPDLTKSEMVVFNSESTGTCYGDSGGPLYTVEADAVKVVGVLSRGTPDSQDCLGSDIQTRTEPALDWIAKVIAGEINSRGSAKK